MGMNKKRRRARVNIEVFDRNSRYFAYFLSDLVFKLLNEYVPMLGGDFQKVLIFHTIALVNSPIIRNNPDAVKDYASIRVRMPVELQVPCTSLSVAESTGLPRETVRRKIREMVEDGFLEQDISGGFRLSSGILQRPEILSVFESNVKSVVDFINYFLEADALNI